MSGVLSALRQLEALGPGTGSLEVFKAWWLKPIYEHLSMDDLCSSSSAAERLARGFTEASLAYHEFPDLIGRYLDFVDACISGQSPRSDFPKPLWVDWIEHTVKAIREWQYQVEVLGTSEMRQELWRTAWSVGITQIRAGRSRVAD